MRQYIIFLQNLPNPKSAKPVTKCRPLSTEVQKKLRYTLDQDKESQEDYSWYVCDNNYTYNASETKIANDTVHYANIWLFFLLFRSKRPKAEN